MVSTASSTGSVTSTLGGSPTKKARKGRKLTNLDRKNICLYRDEHPNLKQDLIAEKFDVERSTVSKILKHRDHWMALKEEDEENEA